MKCFSILLADFFSSHAYFKASQFWKVLIFEPCLFQERAYYRENTVDDHSKMRFFSIFSDFHT